MSDRHLSYIPFLCNNGQQRVIQFTWHTNPTTRNIVPGNFSDGLSHDSLICKLVLLDPCDRLNDELNLHVTLNLWGWVTHICVMKLSQHCCRWLLVTCSAPSHYLNQWWNMCNLSPRNIVPWNLIWNSELIQENAIENVVCNVLTHKPMIFHIEHSLYQ